MIRYFARICRSIFVEENATTAVEYAIMLALIILACIGAVLSTGDVQQELWTTLSDEVHEAVNN